MIYLAGEPDDIWWNGEVKEVYLGADLVWKSGPTIEVYSVEIRNAGGNEFHSLIDLSPPPGEVWEVLVEGTASWQRGTPNHELRVGDKTLQLSEGDVAFVGKISSTSRLVGITTTTGISSQYVTFVGTVTVTKP